MKLGREIQQVTSHPFDQYFLVNETIGMFKEQYNNEHKITDKLLRAAESDCEPIFEELLENVTDNYFGSIWEPYYLIRSRKKDNNLVKNLLTKSHDDDFLLERFINENIKQELSVEENNSCSVRFECDFGELVFEPLVVRKFTEEDRVWPFKI